MEKENSPTSANGATRGEAASRPRRYAARAYRASSQGRSTTSSFSSQTDADFSSRSKTPRARGIANPSGRRVARSERYARGSVRHGTDPSANSRISSGTNANNGERDHDCTTLTNIAYGVARPATEAVPRTT